MSLLHRTISTRKCLSSLPRRSILVQQAFPFSTTINYYSTNSTPKASPFRKPRTAKIPPPLVSSKMVKKVGSSTSTWASPSEVPFQGKVANSINLIGKIETPIQFHATPDGKHVASTFINQKDCTFNGKFSNSLSIPVVFEGDLAHTAACHVKQDDGVYVTGKLSLEPLPFVLSENQGKFYVIGDELKFVKGLERKEAKHVEKGVGNDDVVVSREIRVDKGGSMVEKEWEEYFAKPDQWRVVISQSVGSEGAIEGFEKKVDGKRLDLDSSTPVWVFKKLQELSLDKKTEVKEIGVLNTRKKSDKIKEKEIEQMNTGKNSSSNTGGTAKDAHLNSWNDLLKNPMDWRDFREKKSKGLLTAAFPDFNNKINGTSLWLHSAPKYVWPELKGLGLDVDSQVLVRKEWPAKGVKVKNEDSWKSLVENPDEWWDNRSRKTSDKLPDFIHKLTKVALWLDNSPEWVLSQLPPSKNEQNAYAGNKKALEGADVDAQVQVTKGQPAKGGKVKKEDSWKSLVENPDKWWDYRSRKTTSRAPDFKHKDTGEGLWLSSSSPAWVFSQLPPLANKKAFAA